MQNSPDWSGPACGTAVLAAVVWAVIIVAAVSMALGNWTAINAVIGCSIPACFLTLAAWSFRRQDRRHAESMSNLRARLDQRGPA